MHIEIGHVGGVGMQKRRWRWNFHVVGEEKMKKGWKQPRLLSRERREG